MNSQRLRRAINVILEEIGEDPTRDGLLETPARVARAMIDDLFSGYKIKDPKTLLKTFANPTYKGIVLLKNCPLVSTCEHHLLTFEGVCHVAYIPGRRIVGLSKIARVVDAYARRLQVQERLTQQIADCINDGLKAKGVLVTIAASHSCMVIRGVEKPGTITVTSEVRGVFARDSSAKAEVFQLLKEDSSGH